MLLNSASLYDHSNNCFGVINTQLKLNIDNQFGRASSASKIDLVWLQWWRCTYNRCPRPREGISRVPLTGYAAHQPPAAEVYVTSCDPDLPTWRRYVVKDGNGYNIRGYTILRPASTSKNLYPYLCPWWGSKSCSYPPQIPLWPTFEGCLQGGGKLWHLSVKITK